MIYKWVGAILILLSCGGTGFSIAARSKQQERLLRQLLHVLEFMERELQYRLTPLPELCRQAGREAGGSLRKLFQLLAQELDRQTAADVGCCMASAIRQTPDLPESIHKHLLRLGQMLGRFDLSGQLQGLQSIKAGCKENLRWLDHDRENRLRNYRTLGICAGIALVVLLA